MPTDTRATNTRVLSLRTHVFSPYIMASSHALSLSDLLILIGHLDALASSRHAHWHTYPLAHISTHTGTHTHLHSPSHTYTPPHPHRRSGCTCQQQRSASLPALVRPL